MSDGRATLRVAVAGIAVAALLGGTATPAHARFKQAADLAKLAQQARRPALKLPLQVKATPVWQVDYGVTKKGPLLAQLDDASRTAQKRVVSAADDATDSQESQNLALSCFSEATTATATDYLKETDKQSFPVLDNAASNLFVKCATAPASGPDKATAELAATILLATLKQPTRQVIGRRPEAVGNWLYETGNAVSPAYASTFPGDARTTRTTPKAAAVVTDDDSFFPLGAVLLLVDMVLLGLFFISEQRRSA